MALVPGEEAVLLQVERNGLALDVLSSAKRILGDVLLEEVLQEYGPNVPEQQIRRSIGYPKQKGSGEIIFPCGQLCKLFGAKLPQVASTVLERLQALQTIPVEKQSLTVQRFHEMVEKLEVIPGGSFLHVHLKVAFLGRVVQEIAAGSFLEALPRVCGENVMVEYSQPNTHKAFHVGHMRNVALEDSLVRLFEHCGHNVTAVNYLGDEGAHVAKCLWLLRQMLHEKGDIHVEDLDVPVEMRGEFLGKIYSEAVELLEYSSVTTLPFPDVLAARVESIEKHPNPEAPAHWHVVKVVFGTDDSETATVVCGGKGYSIGDLVAYMPVGKRFNQEIVEPKDMKGIQSHGIMIAYAELGLTPPLNESQCLRKTLLLRQKLSRMRHQRPRASRRNKRKGEMTLLLGAAS
jgi:tRNA-binding EMAP/Myf-like protein